MTNNNEKPPVLLPVAALVLCAALLINQALTFDAGTVPRDKLNTTFTTAFVVQPADLNHLGTLFGGKLMAEMDRTAGITTRRLLYSSKTASAAVTKVSSVEFSSPARTGDLVLVTGSVTKLGGKSVTVNVTAQVERKKSLEGCASGTFVFVAYDPDTKRAVDHGLELP